MRGPCRRAAGAHFRLATVLNDPQSVSPDPAQALQLYKVIAVIDDAVLRESEAILMIVQAPANIASI
jgi:hypothetical protein